MEQSALAYKDIQPYLPGSKALAIDSGLKDVQYFLRKIDDILYITFRGSDSPTDWNTNLTFWKKAIPYGNTASKIRVHSGFIDAYKSPGVRGIIHSSVTQDVHYVKITGHSQGAALAILCAVDVEYNFPDRDIEVIVFGCPRVGNRAFMKSYNKRVVKSVTVENGNDIVTKIPFALWGYRHVGAKLHIGPPRAFGRFSFLDHYPHEYYSSLLKRLL